ncbi:hypothetical protein E1B28_005725 [Marasmius oreades]|uniref:Uncharacterized protein n=1 Tax=Marasmius oreades TaxID=181124 RepID=A0A9P7S3U8_9AGAR|nr:uncharacterized protein E1B28_005725 [Marasmius oreades]KAG7094919.1 hypothetical protein E1B28_005725 [Marasmius oreades]
MARMDTRHRKTTEVDDMGFASLASEDPQFNESKSVPNSYSQHTHNNDMSSSNEPNKTSGRYHSIKGNVVGTIGNLTGSKPWQQSGKEEHAQGEAEYQTAQAKGYVEGTIDRVGGHEDSVIGTLSSDESRRAQGNLPYDKGQA